MSYDKNNALSELDKYNSTGRRMRVDHKRTTDEVANESSQMSSNGESVVNEYETGHSEKELKAWLLWRSAAISLGVVLLLLLALHFKIIKI